MDHATIVVDGRLLQLIYQGLDELPGKIAREAFANIQQQIQRQLDQRKQTDELNAERAKKALELLESFEKKEIDGSKPHLVA